MRTKLRGKALSEAIKKAGGTGALAAVLGISQAAVSQWKECPATRAIAVEKATGIHRTVLRPDVFKEPKGRARPKQPAAQSGEAA